MSTVWKNTEFLVDHKESIPSHGVSESERRVRVVFSGICAQFLKHAGDRAPFFIFFTHYGVCIRGSVMRNQVV